MGSGGNRSLENKTNNYERKKKLGGKNIFIDHDLTKEEREFKKH